MGSKLLSSVSYPPPSKDPVSPTKARIITKGPGDDDARVELSSLSGAYSIRVVDFSGISYEIQFTESTADFAVRVFDVMDFIIKVCFLVLFLDWYVCSSDWMMTVSAFTGETVYGNGIPAEPTATVHEN